MYVQYILNYLFCFIALPRIGFRAVFEKFIFCRISVGYVQTNFAVVKCHFTRSKRLKLNLQENVQELCTSARGNGLI